MRKQKKIGFQPFRHYSGISHNLGADSLSNSLNPYTNRQIQDKHLKMAILTSTPATTSIQRFNISGVKAFAPSSSFSSLRFSPQLRFLNRPLSSPSRPSYSTMVFSLLCIIFFYNLYLFSIYIYMQCFDFLGCIRISS